MRNKFAEVLYKFSKSNNKIRVVAADISPAGKLATLSKKYPDRFINVGVAESSMISMCAGLAMRGLIPFAYTIASFSIFRPFEMVRIDVGYQNLPVVIVGMGAGTVYSTLGGTHITQEDVSVIRCLPNFQILNPCDPMELESCLKYLCSKNKSPCYLRIGKAGEKNFTENSYEKWEFNKPRIIIKGKDDMCLIATGPIIKFFFEILDKLFVGPTSIAYSNDPVSTSKAMIDFAKDNGNLKILGGAMSGKELNIDEIKKLAALPSMEVLKAKILGLLSASQRSLMSTLQANQSNLIRLVTNKNKS